MEEKNIQLKKIPEKRKMGRPQMGPVEKAKDFKGTLKKLIQYISKYHVSLVIVAIFTIASTVFNIIGPKVLGKATTEIFNGLMGKVQGGTGIDFTKIGHILLIMLCLYLTSMIMSYIQGFVMTGVVQKLSFKMRNEIVEKMNCLPMNYYDKHSNGP